ASVGEPARADQVERDAELGVLVFGEDALAGRRFAAQEVGERSPIRAAFPEIDGERAQVEEEDRGEKGRGQRTELAPQSESGDRKSCEERKRETGREKAARDVPVRMEMAENLDREKATDRPDQEESELRL